MYINDSIAAILFENWSVFFIVLLARLEPDEYFLTKRHVFLNSVAVSAVVLVVVSDVSPKGENSFGIEIFFGIALILLAILFHLQSAPQVTQGKNLADPGNGVLILPDSLQEALESDVPGVKDRIETTSLFLIHGLAFLTSSIVALIIFILFELFGVFQGFSGSIPVSGAFILILAGGMLSLFGGITLARGVIIGKNLAVQSVRYLTPVFALLYILALSPLKNTSLEFAKDFSDISEINVSWLIAGVLGIISVGILIQFRGEVQKFGLTAFAIALWLSGLVVFFRDDWQWWVNNIDSPTRSGLEYFGFVAISATVFALLFGFEVARTTQYIEKEEKLAFSLLRRLELLFPTPEDQLVQENNFQVLATYRNGKPVYHKCRTVSDCVVIIDSTTKTNELKEVYNLLLDKLNELKTKPTDNDGYSDASLELNLLTHSKQSGRGTATPLAIIFLGIFTIALSFSLRPPFTTGMNAILVDTFAFLLPATITYLVFYIFDLHYGRKTSIIERETETSAYKVEFASSGSTGETVTGVILIAFVVATYAFLFSLKWLA